MSPRRLRCASTLLSLSLVVAPVARAEEAAWMSVAEAERAFSEYETACQRDGGKLWGMSLCAPVMLVDPRTRAFITNQSPAGPGVAGQAGLFVGALPASENIANTSTFWGGTVWAQVLWPLPGDTVGRQTLLLHESFHRVQESLGLTAREADNAHLDTAEGRILLQLEWRALKQALLGDGARRTAAALDALAFRKARRDRFPGSATAERALEAHEGMAEYTGVMLANPDPAARRRAAVADLETQAARDSFVRSFAYASGPAYGVLLDELGADWRPAMKSGADLGELLGRALHAPATSPAKSLAAREAAYDGAALRAKEEARERAAHQRAESLRKRLVDGPVLRLGLRSMHIQFDPGALVPLSGQGTVYPTARITDDWGMLTVQDGVLVSSDWKSATVAAPRAPRGRSVAGDGWTLELAPGWSLEAGDRPGDLRLKPPPASAP